MVKTLLKNTIETQSQKAEPDPKINLDIAETVFKKAEKKFLRIPETDSIRIN